MKVSDRIMLNTFSKKLKPKIKPLIDNFKFKEKELSFDYLIKASAVYSSNIEGNSIDLNSFMNYELNKDKFKGGKEIEEIENLILAYNFARKNSISERNFLNSHKLLSKTLLIKSKQGKYRIEPVGVFGKSGLAYMAIEPEFIQKEMTTLFDDIKELLILDLTEFEVFYYAAMIHLKFVHIHPFRDGNGRVARLLEKWFITEKLGSKFWTIPSEEYYKNNQQEYYKNINLGVNFYVLDYNKSLDFLLMLPNCLK